MDLATVHRIIERHAPVLGFCPECRTDSPCDPLLVAQGQRERLEGIYIGPWYAGPDATARLRDRLGDALFAERAAAEAMLLAGHLSPDELPGEVARWYTDREAHGADPDGHCRWHLERMLRVVAWPCASYLYHQAGGDRLMAVMMRQAGPILPRPPEQPPPLPDAPDPPPGPPPRSGGPGRPGRGRWRRRRP